MKTRRSFPVPWGARGARRRGVLTLAAPIVAAAAAAACTGLSAPEEVKVDRRTLELEEEQRGNVSSPDVPPDTLWRLEVQFTGPRGVPLATVPVEVAYVLGEWRSDLAPLGPTAGHRMLRDPGEFGDGPIDLAAALRAAPGWLAMRPTQRVVPLNALEPLAPPQGATGLRARLLAVCPLTVRRMRQVNRRAMGDVIAVRTKREEMLWREFVFAGPCREHATPR